jgi:hypothetical protein
MPCDDDSCTHKNSDTKSLYTEALVVGAALVPLWFGVSKATEATRIDFSGKTALDVFIAGFLFHLIAEESGVNAWFLTNSHAAQKTFADTIEGPSHDRQDAPVDSERLAAVVFRA